VGVWGRDGTVRKSVDEFLWAVHSNFSSIFTRFRNTVSFVLQHATFSLPHSYKIFQDHVKYNLRKYFFSNRVFQTWNSLPDFVVASGTINSFKNNLDKFWFNEEVKFTGKPN